MTADLAAPPVTVAAVEDAGRVLPDRFGTTAPPVDIGQISTALGANDAAVVGSLRDAVLAIRFEAGWIEEEGGPEPLPRTESGSPTRLRATSITSRPSTTGR